MTDSEPPDRPKGGIDRREAIRRVSVLLGGVAFVGGSSLLSACVGDRAAGGAGAALIPVGRFTVNDQMLLAEVADTILPETKTPGAKAAGVGPFMAVMVTDCYDAKNQEIFRNGMTQLNAACESLHRTDFMQATPEQRLALIESLDKEQHEYQRTRQEDQPTHYFRMMKELTLLGYFTSEIGYTQAMRYIESPGRYDPCVPYVKGETSWAGHA